MRTPVLEICVDDAAGLAAAVAGGADRIELCSALALGGLTPTPGLIELARLCPVPVYAMVRPHAGPFVYSDADLSAMRHDIDRVRAAGLAGVVFGAGREDGSLDEARLAALAAHSAGLGTTLHRAFDLVPAFGPAVECAVALGFERILTAGGRARAPDALECLAEIVALARGRIAIMPGSGIRPANVEALLDALPVDEIHSSAARPRETGSGRARDLGFDRPGGATDAATVAELKRLLRQAAAARTG